VNAPYNPLDMTNLGHSVLNALLASTPTPLDDVGTFAGAGIYALYYTGDFAPYASLTEQNSDDKFVQPIYVGKAVPSGARRGIEVATTANTRALSSRIRQHAASIRAATNLDITDFAARWLIVEPIWIPLGESIMIARHAPLWNALIDGFGNHDPGTGRIAGVRSRWDTLHPGRFWAEKFPARSEAPADIAKDIVEYLHQRMEPPLTLL
jgi:hypothetical protein